MCIKMLLKRQPMLHFVGKSKMSHIANSCILPCNLFFFLLLIFSDADFEAEFSIDPSHADEVTMRILWKFTHYHL